MQGLFLVLFTGIDLLKSLGIPDDLRDVLADLFHLFHILAVDADGQA